MPRKTRGAAWAFGTEVFEPCQGFGLLKNPLDDRIKAGVPLGYGKERIASLGLRLESIRKEGVSPLQLISRDHGFFQRVGLCKRLDPGYPLCHIICEELHSHCA
jgi:hypothetical protein